MPKTHVSRTITIDAPKEKVMDVVSDFHHWSKWSPWLICEPEASVDVAEDGQFYRWQGKRVGSGEMRIRSIEDQKVISDLLFLKPWKSQAKVTFNFEEQQNKTHVEWVMDSSLPFFMFWMKKSMEAYIGMDFERGLRMLKDVVEEGQVPAKLEFVGIQEVQATTYIGITTSGSYHDIGQLMEKDFIALYDYAKEKSINITGSPFSQYHKFDVVNEKVKYTAGIPVSDSPEELPSGFFLGKLPSMKVNTVRLHGAYDYLGNAWTANMMMARAKEFKQNKNIHPLEFYQNDPAETPPSELVTDVSIAIKS